MRIENLTSLEGINELLNETYSIPLIFILSVYFLTIGFIDYKTKKIPNNINFTMLISRILLIPFLGLSWEHLLGGLIGFLIILLPAMLANQPMGGDIKMAGILGLYVGPNLIVLFTILSFSLLYVLMYVMFKKEKTITIPVAPFYMIVHMFLTILYFI